MPLHLRAFISSPGDVADERNLARRLLKDELPYDPFLRGKVTLDPVSWDDPAAQTPMVATLTPQEAVNRFGCRPSKCAIVIVVLWSRIGTHLDLSKFQKPNGKPYLSGTEYEYEEAVNTKHPSEILVYRRTEKFSIYADDPKFDEKREQYRKVQAFFDRFKNPDGSYRAGFTGYATPTDFVSRLETDLKLILQQRLEAAQRAPATAVDVGPPQTSSPLWTSSPYPGLRPFDVTEAAIFFGRGRETDALIARLRDRNQRFLAIIGASGSGKSSLVRAGLLPRLQEGAIEGSPHWRVLTLTPGAAGGNPFLVLAFELASKLPPNMRKPEIEIAEELANKPQRITEYAATLLAESSVDGAVVLFVDQMEELFTIVATSHRIAFLELLAHAAADPRRLRVLATLRADFLSQAVAEPTLRPLLQAPTGTYLLAPVLALADIIRRPAERAGVEIEEDVVYEILKDAGTDPGALPLVAFCLDELYRSSAPARRLTAAAYDKLGRLRRSIARRAEAALSNLQKTESMDLDTTLPKLFRRLVHVDSAGTVTLRWAVRDELVAEPPLLHLIETLIKERLLQAAGADGRATITLAHEALIHSWQRLRDWVDQNQEFLRTRERLAAGAQLWEDEGRPHDRLLPPGRPLAEGEDLLATRSADLDLELIAYIDASAKAAREHETNTFVLDLLHDVAISDHSAPTLARIGTRHVLPEQAAAIICERLTRFYKWDNVSIFSVVQDRFELLAQDAEPRHGYRLPERYTQYIYDGLLGKALCLKRALYEGDVYNGPLRSHYVQASALTKSALVCPIEILGRTPWLINIEDSRINAFCPDHCEALERIAQGLRPILENLFTKIALEYALDVASDGILRTDLNGRVILANRSAAAMLKMPPNQLISRNFSEFIDDPEQATALGNAENFGPRILKLKDSKQQSLTVALSICNLPEHDRRFIFFEDLSTIEQLTMLSIFSGALYELTSQTRLPLSLGMSMLRKLNAADRDTKDLLNRALWQLSKAERTFERIALYGDAGEPLPSRFTPIALKGLFETLFNAFSPDVRAGVEVTDLCRVPDVQGDCYQLEFVFKTILDYLERRKLPNSSICIEGEPGNNFVLIRLSGIVGKSPQDAQADSDADFVVSARAEVVLAEKFLRRFIEINHGGAYQREMRDHRMIFTIRLPIAGVNTVSG